MKRWLIGAISVVLGLAATSPAGAQGMIVPCAAADGVWDWPIGGVVEIAPDGRASWSPAPDLPPAFLGDWHCDPEAGQTVIVWQHGVTDRLSRDGDRLIGTNDAGLAIDARLHGSVTAATPPEGPVPPMLVGTWVAEIWLPTPAGPVPVVWTIAEDGSYVIEAGPHGHAGTMTAHGGSWEQTATTRSFTDGGSYDLPNWARLNTRARSGVAGWNRIEPALTLDLAEVSGQALPAGLPGLAGKALAVARGWRPDAALLAIDFRRRDSNQRGAQDEVTLRFASQATGSGLSLTVDPAGARPFVHDVVHWGGDAIPEGFLDLPTAWAIARQHGLEPPLQQADLRVWRPGDEPVLAWQLGAPRGATRGITLDGVEGGQLDGDISGYIASYNAQWQAAAEGLRRLFAQPRPSPAASFSSGASTSWSSDSGTTDSGSGGNSGPDYDTAAQNSWGAGDSRAYDRIMSGMPTGDDCYRYGC